MLEYVKCSKFRKKKRIISSTMWSDVVEHERITLHRVRCVCVLEGQHSIECAKANDTCTNAIAKERKS